MPDVVVTVARLREFLDSERDRQKLRDLLQHDREVMPGTAGGRALPAAPLDHRARGTARGTLQALSPSPVGGGTPEVHHVTATAVASQDIAAGGATVEWTDEEDAPTERRGFETFHQQLQDGAVGDIPIDRDGFLILKPKLQFENSATGDALDETGVDATVKVQRIRDGIVKTVRGALTGSDVIGLSGPIDCGDAKNGDKFRVTIDPGENIKCSGTIQAAQWITGQSAAASWTQVSTGDVWGLTRLDGSWWTTDGDGKTVVEYDDSWTQQSSFSVPVAGQLRGITNDGTDLWVTGDATTTVDEETIFQYSTAGTRLSSFATGTGSTDGNAGLAYDGTDLWLYEGTADEIEQWSTAGTRLSAFAAPDGIGGLAYHDGRLYLLDKLNAQIVVYETDGTQVDTIDVSAATESPTGVFVDTDGTIYVSEDGVGVWRRD